MLTSSQYGRELELIVLGSDCLEFPDELPTYVPFIRGVAVARAAQEEYGWNPFRPKTSLGRKMLNAVRQALYVGDPNKLGLYTAIGSALDFYHGVDCFFAFQQGGDSVASVDLATGRSWTKIRDYKADILVTDKQLVREEFYPDFGHRVARIIAMRTIRVPRVRRRKGLKRLGWTNL